MKNKKKLYWYLLLVFGLLLTGCGSNLTGSIGTTIDDEKEQLVVHYIDVGQGDSIFLELPNQETMLIDAGEKEYGDTVKEYIKDLGYKKIDYLVGTHPHSDHIGGLEEVVNNFEIEKVYMPKVVHTSNTYLNLLKAIDNKGLKIINAKAGMNILTEEDLQIDVLAPNKDEYASLNNYSIVLKIRYKDRTFLFTGDAEKLSEEEILENGRDIQADVVKVGHHGSDTSSSHEFMKKVKASYAIVSVGKGNKYNHPTPSILKNWESLNAKVYRTDEEGTIVVTTDGKNVQVKNKDTVIDSGEIKETDEEITLKSLTDPIKKGEETTIEVKGKPNTMYSIQVFYKSGVSSATGLEDKKSDDNGNVSWTWKVASNVTAGTYKIIIKGDTSEKEIKYTIH